MSIFDLLNIKRKIRAPWKKYYKKRELNFKIPDISMYQEVKNTSLKYPDNIAYKYFTTKVTYKKFIKQIDKIALSFKNLGVVKGDIITICLPNTPESLICVYALNKLGAIANMIHPLSAEEEIKESITSTNSKMIIILDMNYKKIKNLLALESLEKIIYSSPADSMNIFMKTLYKISQINKYEHPKNNGKVISYKRFRSYALLEKEILTGNFGRDTPAVILHSGGTSGKPKNVVIQNRAFLLAARQEKIALKNLKEGDCCLAIMPNFHGFGLSVCMHTPLALGCYTVLIPQFNSKKFDTLFKKTKPTCVLGVPTLFEALINSNNEKNIDLSFLKYVISGGDLLNKNLEEKVNNYLHEHNSTAHITQGYGLSEALAAVCLGHDNINKQGSVGIPLAGNYIKIIDEATRKSMPSKEIGEICIHTNALMMGYLNNEKETNEALQVHKDGHVWLHTGDLGYLDEDGFLFYKGRKKRMIITSGYNVYPSHIEEIIESHPAVLQCTVVAEKHPYKQEVPKAFIVLKEGHHGLFIKSEIKEYCKKNLAHYMIPYKFVYRKQLPKTKLGKVDFKSLQNDNGEDDDE